MRILVLGGYGMIGSAVVRHLADRGHEVTGLGRDVAEARRQMPQAHWIAGDIATLATPTAWHDPLAACRPQAIVNCAGVLQDGSRDDVAAVQARAMTALYAAAEAAAVGRFVQISAPRADAGRDSPFMRTKGEADAALAASRLEWTILRPGLVIGPQAYGGTALLRGLAGVPLLQPLSFPRAPLQTVAVWEVAGAVAACVEGQVPARRTYDLVEDDVPSLAEVVAKLRAWQGRAPAPVVTVPEVVARMLARLSDGLGWLGWRAPLRTAALTEIAAGVSGDPEPWRQASGRRLASLDETLKTMPATVQERWFSRGFLVKPLAIATLAAFWIATGAITLAAPDAAAHVLRSQGMAAAPAYASAISGALLDIVLGFAVLVRRTMVMAALGMIATTLVYLAGASVVAPGLWLDPLGPLVKAIPAAVLAVVVLALAEDR